MSSLAAGRDGLPYRHHHRGADGVRALRTAQRPSITVIDTSALARLLVEEDAALREELGRRARAAAGANVVISTIAITELPQVRDSAAARSREDRAGDQTLPHRPAHPARPRTHRKAPGATSRHTGRHPHRDGPDDRSDRLHQLRHTSMFRGRGRRAERRLTQQIALRHHGQRYAGPADNDASTERPAALRPRKGAPGHRPHPRRGRWPPGTRGGRLAGATP